MRQRLLTYETLMAFAWGICACVLTARGSCPAEAQQHPSVTPGLKGNYTITQYHDDRGTLHLAVRGPFPGKHIFSFPAHLASDDFASENHRLAIGRRSRPDTDHPSATVSIFGRTAVLFFSMRRGNRETAIRFTLAKDSVTVPLKRGQVSHIRTGRTVDCSQHNYTAIPTSSRIKLASLASQRERQGVSARGTPREVEMNVFYDVPYAQRAGLQPHEAISASIFSANERLLKSAGIRVRLKYLGALPSEALSYSSSVSENILEQFRNWNIPASKSADLFHLFTGAPLEDATAGVAFVGSACRNGGRFAVGLSRFTTLALQPIVFAHEVLHGLGAPHDNAPYSLMDPVLTSANTQVSQSARMATARFINKDGRCIGHPKSLGASLHLESSGGFFKANFELRNPPPIPCSLRLLGQMPPDGNSTKLAHPGSRWSQVTTVRVPATSPVSRAWIRVTATEPLLGQRLQKGILFRAAIQCGDLKTTTSTQEISPSVAAAVGTEVTERANWLAELGQRVEVNIDF
jgi:hypothetical protein